MKKDVAVVCTHCWCKQERVSDAAQRIWVLCAIMCAGVFAAAMTVIFLLLKLGASLPLWAMIGNTLLACGAEAIVWYKMSRKARRIQDEDFASTPGWAEGVDVGVMPFVCGAMVIFFTMIACTQLL